MITLEAVLVEGRGLSEPDAPISVASEVDLRYGYVLDDFRFRLEAADFSVGWGWAPLLGDLYAG